MSETGQSMITILMLIGGSPGSTAGGMKTTTIAVLLANVIAVFSAHRKSTLFSNAAFPQKRYHGHLPY